VQRRRLKMTLGVVQITAALNVTTMADLIWKALPIEAECQTWGDEIYFEIGIQADEDEGQEVVEMGDIGYWPPGRAFCVFFGPTPVSSSDEIRPASPVNVFGFIEGDATVLKQVRSGERVVVERA